MLFIVGWGQSGGYGLIHCTHCDEMGDDSDGTVPSLQGRSPIILQRGFGPSKPPRVRASRRYSYEKQQEIQQSCTPQKGKAVATFGCWAKGPVWAGALAVRPKDRPTVGHDVSTVRGV